MMTFSFGGGKFTRYFTTVLPAVLITAAIGNPNDWALAWRKSFRHCYLQPGALLTFDQAPGSNSP